MGTPFEPIQLGNVKAEDFERWFERVFGRKPHRCTIPLFKQTDFNKNNIVTISGGNESKFTWHTIRPKV